MKGRGFKAAAINEAMTYQVDLFNELPTEFQRVQGGIQKAAQMFNDIQVALQKFATSGSRNVIGRRRVKTFAEIREKAQELLGFVGLLDKQSAFAEHMSHGQKRLLELARALALDPDLLLLDEPMAGLSPVMVEQMKDHIKKVRDGGKTILFISHDMDVVMDISDQVIVINYGKKIAAGTPQEIQNNEDVLNAYLGKKHLA